MGYREHSNSIYSVTKADCKGHGGNLCENANWWSSFDKKGMSQCNDGSYVAGVYRNHCDKLYWWSSFDKAGWSRCSKDYYIAGLYRNNCNHLYCLEEAKCCKPAEVKPNHAIANWWSSFDKKGWSTCTKHGKGYKYIDGIFRNHCNKLYCIEEVSCSTSPHHNEEQKCVSANWWSSMDKKGWSTCAEGSFISGLYRNDCSDLYCLEMAKCCTSKVHVEKWNGCYDANWWSSFDKRGWSSCNVGYHLTGLYRNTCNDLYCIEMAKCCKSSLAQQ